MIPLPDKPKIVLYIEPPLGDEPTMLCQATNIAPNTEVVMTYSAGEFKRKAAGLSFKATSNLPK